MSHGNPSTTQDDDLLAVLRMLAERAGKIALAYYAEGGEIEVRDKSDASPVTEADEACEAFLLDALAKLTPDIPVVSEEAAAQDGFAGHRRRPGVLAGRPAGRDARVHLSQRGIHRQCRVDQGAQTGRRRGACAGDGHDLVRRFSTTRAAATPASAKPIARPCPSRRGWYRTRGRLSLPAAVTAPERSSKAFLAARKIAQRVTAGSSLKFCLLASGKADLYPRFGRTMEWDTAAGQAVLAAAGGRVETLDGQPLRYGKAGFAQSELHRLRANSPIILRKQ